MEHEIRKTPSSSTFFIIKENGQKREQEQALVTCPLDGRGQADPAWAACDYLLRYCSVYFL